MKETDSPIQLEAKDCSPFHLQGGQEKALQYAITHSDRLNVFRCSPAYRVDDDEPLAWFNYKDGKWWAGRFIGEATFSYEQKTYKIVITPRFGQAFIVRMFEVIFNVRLLESQSAITKSESYESLLRRLIALIWLRKLADANRHGLPRTNAADTYTGASVKGQMNVQKTIQSYTAYDQITSNIHTRINDPVVTTLLWQTYLILSKRYGVRQLSHPDSAADAIQHLQRMPVLNKRITFQQYRSIRYKVLYQSFKPVVDLSWQIVTNSLFISEDKANAKGFGLFLDVAELWETYLYMLFKRAYTPLGWAIEKPEVVTYQDKLFQRKLIPDIVLTKGDWRCIWDAKYKRMNFSPYDIDRADFFQIHTYATYFSSKYSVLSCGLIYPADSEPMYENKLTDHSLFGLEADDTIFSISSMNVNNFQTVHAIEKMEDRFISGFLTKYMKTE